MYKINKINILTTIKLKCYEKNNLNK